VEVVVAVALHLRLAVGGVVLEGVLVVHEIAVVEAVEARCLTPGI
jgi:hypothetical protein